MRSELVLDALEMAVSRRRPAPGLIHHSDQGSRYVSLAFGQAARDAGIARSIGSRGDCYDNAVAESLFATRKKELVHRRSWPTRRELASEVFEYVEAFYNRTAGTPPSATYHPPTTRTELSSSPVRASPLRGSHTQTTTTRSPTRFRKPNHVRQSGGTPLSGPPVELVRDRVCQALGTRRPLWNVVAVGVRAGAVRPRASARRAQAPFRRSVRLESRR
jgi:Integrase core domain